METCPNCGSARAGGARFCTWCGTAFTNAPPAIQRRSIFAVLGVLSALSIFGCLAVCVMLILIVEVQDPTGLVLSIIAAVIPAVFYSLLVLYLDRNEKEPWYILVGAFAWGAVVAVFFSYIFNSVAAIAIAVAYGLETSEFLTVVVVAPFFEEIFKGAALLVLLLLFRSYFDNVLDGIVYGALVGLGFAMTENITYFGRAYFDAGIFGLGVLFVIRVVIGGLGHALYTATTGAALGWARAQYGTGIARFIVPVVGLGAAMLQHSLWNMFAYVAGTIAAREGAIVALLIALFIEPVLFILPGVVVIVIIAVITSRREQAIIRHELREEVEMGVLTGHEYDQVSHGPARRKASMDALRSGGPALWLEHRKLIRLSARLAFQKYHISQGELGRRGLRYRSPAELRAQIIASRANIYRRQPRARGVS